MNRRKFITGLGGATVGAAFLAACGDTIKIYNQMAPTGSTLMDRRIGLFTWADYDDPEITTAWGDVRTTYYTSNEDLIAKLTAAKGYSGFDVVVPTGPYVPELARRGLLEQLDLDRIPNFNQLDPSVVDQPFDRHNTFTVCKATGTLGWVYDSAVVGSEITTWADFLAAAQGPASGKTTLVDTGPELFGLYCWARGLDWTSDNADDIAAAKQFLINDIAPHLAALDAIPYNAVVDREYKLMMAYNGVAIGIFTALDDAGIDTSTWKWAVGGPVTESYMDNWAIVKGARNLDAAYDFINYMLQPVTAARAALYQGSSTGTSSLAELLPVDMRFKELYFFTEEERARMQPWKYNKAVDQLAELVVDLKKKVNGGGQARD